MKATAKKSACKIMIAGFLLAAMAGWFRAAAAAQTLPENILRLHVVANSDSPEDQALKLKVRDAVLEEAGRWCQGAKTLEEANFQVCTHLEGITRAAKRRVEEEGSAQKVGAMVTEMYFPTKEYGEYALPAGRYRALRVELGEGKGKNWWCVVFPALCLPAAGEGDPLAGLSEEQRDLTGRPEKYKVEFKLVELYESLRSWLAGE